MTKIPIDRAELLALAMKHSDDILVHTDWDALLDELFGKKVTRTELWEYYINEIGHDVWPGFSKMLDDLFEKDRKID